MLVPRDGHRNEQSAQSSHETLHLPLGGECGRSRRNARQASAKLPESTGTKDKKAKANSQLVTRREKRRARERERERKRKFNKCFS